VHIALDGRFISDHYPGIGRYAYQLAALLPALAPDDRFTLLVNPRSDNRRFDLGPIVDLPNVTALNVRASPLGLAQELELRRAASRLRFDLYHSPCHMMPYTLPCPTVATIHDLIPWACPESLSPARRAAYSAVIHLTARRAARIIVDSEATRADLARWLPATTHKIDRVYLATGESFEERGPQEARAFRLRTGLPERYVLHVGTNKPHKNVTVLLHAWAALDPAYRRSHRLVLAGPRDPNDTRDLDLARTLGIDGSVRSYGAVPEQDLGLLYQNAEVFVFPSLYEGFGLPVLEAMSVGTPVACSNRSSLPEVGGEAAVYFDPRDAGDIARALTLLLTDPAERQRRSAAGRLRAQAFSWEATARETLATYRRAIA
jgi:glycosyltransferase involved in cell wall biosynthesis